MADTFELKSGGKIEGAWINRSASPIEHYIIDANGLRLTIRSKDVQRIVRGALSPDDIEKHAASYPDTVDGQWRFAQWCLRQNLKSQHRAALERVVVLEPNHEEARAALGHHWLKGRWVSPEKVRRDQGMVRQGGLWQHKEELEFAQRKKADEVKAKKWRKTLQRWRNRLDTKDHENAFAQIVAVRDPLAVPALLELIQTEPTPRMQQVYVQVVAAIHSPESIRALSQVVMEAPIGDTFDEALRMLQRRSTPDLVEHFVKKLTSNDNAIVNRAATVLRSLGDDSAASPLIDALVTKHWRQRGTPRKTMTEVAEKWRVGGSSNVPEYEIRPVGLGSPRTLDPSDVVWDSYRNEEVLRALCELVGDQGFGFRQDAWRIWHNALLNIRRQEQLRRDR